MTATVQMEAIDGLINIRVPGMSLTLTPLQARGMAKDLGKVAVVALDQTVDARQKKLAEKRAERARIDEQIAEMERDIP